MNERVFLLAGLSHIMQAISCVHNLNKKGARSVIKPGLASKCLKHIYVALIRGFHFCHIQYEAGSRANSSISLCKLRFMAHSKPENIYYSSNAKYPERVSFSKEKDTLLIQVCIQAHFFYIPAQYSKINPRFMDQIRH